MHRKFWYSHANLIRIQTSSSTRNINVYANEHPVRFPTEMRSWKNGTTMSTTPIVDPINTPLVESGHLFTAYQETAHNYTSYRGFRWSDSREWVPWRRKQIMRCSRPLPTIIRGVPAWYSHMTRSTKKSQIVWFFRARSLVADSVSIKKFDAVYYNCLSSPAVVIEPGAGTEIDLQTSLRKPRYWGC